jgi:segregation and condensation protein A
MIYNFTVNDFEGPLDLLLHLIRSSKMDIYDINIESITKQYLDFINNSKEMNMDIAADYLVMAAELIHLKSRTLLHKDDEEESDEYELNSAEDLRDRLLEYQQMKEVTSTFKELEDRRSDFYTKLPSDLSDFREEGASVNPGDVSVDDLVNALKLFLEREKLNKPLNTKITKKELSVGDRTVQIRNILKTKKKCEFTSLFEQVTKPYVVVTFLSVLNMSKNNEINITQDKNFGDIYLEMK